MLDLLDIHEISPLSAGIATIAVVLVVLLYHLKDRGLPPGPTGLPFLGYYPFLEEEYHLQLQKLANKYGDVFSFSVSGQLYVHLNTVKVLREAHISKGDCFGRRMSRYSVLKYCFNSGMTFQEGDAWKTLRKFYVQSLKEYGLSSLKGNMAGPVYDSLTATIEDLKNTKGAIFESVALLTKHCTTTIQELLFCGVNVTKEDLDTLIVAHLDLMNVMKGRQFLLTGPIAEYVILPFTAGNSAMKTSRTLMETMLLKIIREHESTLDEDHPRDVVDCYIRERNIRTRNEDPTATYFTNIGLASSLLQMVGDGALGAGYFISSFLDTLCHYPEVQEKIYEEIIEVIGHDRQPTWEDKSLLHYTNAAILEMIRHSYFFPIVPSLECTKETTLNGYKIPKGSVTLVNIWAIQHDPQLYEDPYTFDPLRYIAKPGKPKAESPILFGVGKRACSGESFAMMEVFLFLVTVVKNFKLCLPPEKEGVPRVTGLTDDIKMEMCAHPRKQN